MNVNDKPLSFNVDGKQVDSFATLEEARKAAIGRQGNEAIVENTDVGLFEYKGKSTFTVHDAKDLNPEALKKDAIAVNQLSKGINAVEFIFDKGNDAAKTDDQIYAISEGNLNLQKDAGKVFAFNNPELGKGTIRVIKNDDKNFSFALSIKETPDRANDFLFLHSSQSVHDGLKNYLKTFIDSNSFGDGDEEDDKMLKNQLKHAIELSVDRAMEKGALPEIIVSKTLQKDGSHKMSVTTDFPIAGLTEKDLNKLSISSTSDGKTVIPFGTVKATTNIGKSDNPTLALEFLGSGYVPIDIPLKEVGNQYTTEKKTFETQTNKAFDKLSTDQTVEINTGATWVGGKSPELSISAAYKQNFKDYPAAKLNYGGKVDVLPGSGQFQATPTVGANITGAKYYSIPLSLNVDVGPSLGNMNNNKGFSFGINTAVGLKYNVANKVDIGVNYGHVFGIKAPDQNTVSASVGFKF